MTREHESRLPPAEQYQLQLEEENKWPRRREIIANLVKTLIGFIILYIALTALINWDAKAAAWDLETMNKTVAQTNFVVAGGCSGTLISVKHRLVLTNHHCIDRMVTTVKKKVTNDEGVVKEVELERLLDVKLEQHRYAEFRRVASSEYQSVIVARKKDSDLALLQIRATELPFSEESHLLPDDVTLTRGELVWIVGNPAGLDATILSGIISSLNRTFRVWWANNEEVPFIQVSGGVFGGNSGGALYNKDGYLIGVPAAAISGSNLGFAVPISTVKEFLKENCWQEIWMSGAPSHDVCVAEKEKKKDD